MVLPIFLALYRKLYANKKYKLDQNIPSHGSTETSPLPPPAEDTSLSGHTNEQVPSVQKQIASQAASAAQELLITRICFLIDAMGMILVSLSRDSTGIMICKHFTAMELL